MQILEELPQGLSYPIMTIGVFDGLHFGHQEILRRLVRRAKAKDGTSVLLTFTPHPQKIISSGDAPSLLQTFPQKAEMLRRLGKRLQERGWIRLSWMVFGTRSTQPTSACPRPQKQRPE